MSAGAPQRNAEQSKKFEIAGSSNRYSNRRSPDRKKSVTFGTSPSNKTESVRHAVGDRVPSHVSFRTKFRSFLRGTTLLARFLFVREIGRPIGEGVSGSVNTENGFNTRSSVTFEGVKREFSFVCDKLYMLVAFTKLWFIRIIDSLELLFSTMGLRIFIFISMFFSSLFGILMVGTSINYLIGIEYNTQKLLEPYHSVEAAVTVSLFGFVLLMLPVLGFWSICENKMAALKCFLSLQLACAALLVFSLILALFIVHELYPLISGLNELAVMKNCGGFFHNDCNCTKKKATNIEDNRMYDSFLTIMQREVTEINEPAYFRLRQLAIYWIGILFPASIHQMTTAVATYFLMRKIKSQRGYYNI